MAVSTIKFKLLSINVAIMGVMKISILYKPKTETGTPVEDFLREFSSRTGKSIEAIDAESHEGIEIAKALDILQFPVLLVRENDGTLVQSWVEMDKWPTISELSFYSQ